MVIFDPKLNFCLVNACRGKKNQAIRMQQRRQQARTRQHKLLPSSPLMPPLLPPQDVAPTPRAVRRLSMDNVQAADSTSQRSPIPRRAASLVIDEAPVSPIVHCSCIAHRSLQLVNKVQQFKLSSRKESEPAKRTDHKFVLKYLKTSTAATLRRP